MGTASYDVVKVEDKRTSQVRKQHQLFMHGHVVMHDHVAIHSHVVMCSHVVHDENRTNIPALKTYYIRNKERK